MKRNEEEIILKNETAVEYLLRFFFNVKANRDICFVFLFIFL
jgi:hypothetical protein